MITFFLVYVIPACILFLILFVNYFREKYHWNGGICRRTGTPWNYFDVDSQGGRGYESEDFILWVSCPYVDGRT